MNELTSRYAQALYSLKEESNTLLEAQEEVKELIKVIKDNPDFVVLLNSHFLEKEKRVEIVERVFASIDVDIKNFIIIIVENNRSLYLLEILSDFNSLVNGYRGVKEGIVFTALPLEDVELNKLEKKISEIEGCPVELKQIIDPSLIGGVKVAISDHVYDGSLKHHIMKLKKTLLKKEDDINEN